MAYTNRKFNWDFDKLKRFRDKYVTDSIIKNGPAFDLSAYNAVGGTLATYADLTAALTALNALPAAYKKGGMSIKFVQSSDNKYVQYFLTKDEWSLSEADWEKMNLEEELSQLGQEVTDRINNIENTLGESNTEVLNYGRVEDTYFSNTLIGGLKYNIKVDITQTGSWTRFMFCKTQSIASDVITIIQSKTVETKNVNFVAPDASEYPYIYVQNLNQGGMIVTATENFGVTKQVDVNSNSIGYDGRDIFTFGKTGDYVYIPNTIVEGTRLNISVTIDWTGSFTRFGFSKDTDSSHVVDVSILPINSKTAGTISENVTAPNNVEYPYIVYRNPNTGNVVVHNLGITGLLKSTSDNKINIGVAKQIFLSFPNTSIVYNVPNTIVEGTPCTATIDITSSGSWTRFGFSKDGESLTNAMIVIASKDVSGVVSNTFVAPNPQDYPYIIVQNPSTNNLNVINNGETNILRRLSVLEKKVQADDLDTFAKKVYDAIDGDCSVFVHITDSHSGYSLMPLTLASKHMQKIGKIAEKVNAKFVIHTGDAIHGYESTAPNAFDSYRALLQNYASRVPLIFAEGNYVHDFGYNGEIDRKQVQSLFGKSKEWYEHICQYNENDINSYFYFDLDGVRYIILDAQDYNPDNRVTTYGFSTQQVTFVTSALSDALSHNLPVVFFSHMPPVAELFPIVGGETKDYGMGTNGAAMASAIYSFTANNGVVLAYIHGHMHWDNFYYDSIHNIPYVCMLNEFPAYETVNACAWGNPITYARSKYDVTQYAVDVYVINKDTHLGSILRYGAGVDRFITRE